MGTLLTYDAMKCLGVDSITEQTDVPKDKWEELAGVVPRPYGAFNRPPIFSPLWQMPNIVSYRTALGITVSGQTHALKVQKGNVIFLYFVKISSFYGGAGWEAFSRGLFLAAGTAADLDSADFLTGTATVTLLMSGLNANRRWRCARALDRLILGNGVDPNLIYDTAGGLRASGSSLVPAQPTVAISPIATYPFPNPAGTDTTGGFLGRYQVRLTYFDPGSGGYGYESAPGATTVPIYLRHQGLRVFVVGSSNRFSKMRIYIREFPEATLGETASKSYYFLKEIPNATDTFDFDGTDDLGVALTQNGDIPPPCDKFLFFANRLWMSGNSTHPSYVWYSKLSTKTELVPEGIEPSTYIAISGNPEEEGARPVVTALHSYKALIAAHTNKSTCTIDPVTLKRTNSRNNVGALNNNCVVGSSLGRSYFLARDFTLYEFDSQFNAFNTRRRALSRESIGYIRKRINLAAALKNEEAANIFFDSQNNLVWIACNLAARQTQHTLKSVSDVVGTAGIIEYYYEPNAEARLFCLDVEKEQLFGPYIAPSIFDTAIVDPLYGKIAFCDMCGQLNYLSLDLTGETLATNGAFSPVPESTAIAATGVGDAPSVIHDSQPWAVAVGKPPLEIDWGNDRLVIGPDGETTWSNHCVLPYYLQKGQPMRLETPWMDFGKPLRRKAIYFVLLRFVRNSRCSLKVTALADEGAPGGNKVERKVAEYYADAGGDVKLPMSISGTRLKLVVEMTVGEDKPCMLRGLSIQYEVQGEKSAFAF